VSNHGIRPFQGVFAFLLADLGGRIDTQNECPYCITSSRCRAEFRLPETWIKPSYFLAETIMRKDLYGASLFDQLKSSASSEWNRYCHHDFVNQIGEGSLPVSAFRYYLEQDYVFLIHFSRAWALAAYKSTSLDDMKWASEILHSTLHTEMKLHVLFSERYGVSQQDLESADEAKDNLAYTRFVLDQGLSEDLLNLYVALMPCVVGYAEIGLRLSLDYAHCIADNPYREWIDMYSSDDYQELAIKSISRLERIGLERGANSRIKNLIEVFRKATVLETDFWSMCHQSVD